MTAQRRLTGTPTARANNITQATEMLSQPDLQEYKDIFSFFDRDGGGSITAVELGQVFEFMMVIINTSETPITLPWEHLHP